MRASRGGRKLHETTCRSCRSCATASRSGSCLCSGPVRAPCHRLHRGILSAARRCTVPVRQRSLVTVCASAVAAIAHVEVGAGLAAPAHALDGGNAADVARREDLGRGELGGEVLDLVCELLEEAATALLLLRATRLCTSRFEAASYDAVALLRRAGEARTVGNITSHTGGETHEPAPAPSTNSPLAHDLYGL